MYAYCDSDFIPACMSYIGIFIWKYPHQKLYAVTYNDIQECWQGSNEGCSRTTDVLDSSSNNKERDYPCQKKNDVKKRH